MLLILNSIKELRKYILIMVKHMYYLNSFLLYSVIGFIMESTIYKFNHTNKFSGIYYGPFTAVYGVGVVCLLIANKYLFKKMKTNKYLKVILVFILSSLILTFVELCGGLTSKLIFNIDMWDYTNKLFNMGKYICLELTFIWGLLGTMFIYIIKPFMDRFIKKIPKKATYFFTLIYLIDLIVTLITK